MRAVVVPREDVVLVLINAVELRAGKTSKSLSNSSSQRREHIANITLCARDIGKSSLRDLKQEAFQVVSLKQVASIEDALGQRSKIHDSERIRLASVSSDVQQGRILLAEIKNVSEEAWDGVFVADCALVPVVWNALVAGGVSEFSGLACDGEEGHELGP